MKSTLHGITRFIRIDLITKKQLQVISYRALRDMSKCEIYKEVGAPGVCRWISATEIRSLTIDDRFFNGTVGTFLSAETQGASTYPNQIRYGDVIVHYPPETMLEVAKTIIDWAKVYWDHIRLVPTSS